MHYLSCVLAAVYVSLEQEIDGEAFLELTEVDVKDMIKPLGQVKKVMRIQKAWNAQKKKSDPLHETSVSNI